MDKTPKDPVNYEIKETDLHGDFPSFLNTVTDVPSSPSLHPVEINEAGITNQQAYVKIKDIDGKGDEKPVLCNIEIGVNLEGHRGIHMSRCEEVLFELSHQSHKSLDDFAIALARGIREKQGSKGCVVKVNGLYLHNHPTKITKRVSQDKIYLLSKAEVTDNSESVQTGVKAFNINACPCTRAYTKFSAIPALQEAGFDHEQIKKILDIVITGSHTQRGTISVVIDKTHPEIEVVPLPWTDFSVS
ncbi:GTP cyclohydrolase I FolE2 [Patescibacteria group bacterium]|nr:GTP cyclohydrolase I FolE2 [Patescibacteria group bacterium]